MPAKLNSTQLRRHAGGKDSWPLLPATSVLMSEGHRRQYRRPVAGSSAANENQALVEKFVNCSLGLPVV